MYERRSNPDGDRSDSSGWSFRRRRRPSRRSATSRASRFARRLGMGVAAVSGVFLWSLLSMLWRSMFS